MVTVQLTDRPKRASRGMWNAIVRLMKSNNVQLYTSRIKLQKERQIDEQVLTDSLLFAVV